MIYLDNAATTFPKPAAVKAGTLKYFYDLGGNPGRSGHDLSLRTAKAVYACRQELAGFFHVTNPDQVVFTQNCTHALNLAIKGLLKKGDHVVISDLEHNSVYRPIHTMAQKGIITYDAACTDPVDGDRTVDAFEACLKPNTRLIACTHCSNVFGIVLPIGKLAALARARGILFLVDAAQSAGVLPLDMERSGIDFAAVPGHKGLYGPTGTGALVINNDHLPEPLMEGGTGSLSLEGVQPEDLPDRLESGTLNTLGILGLREGVRFVSATGTPTIRRHEAKLCKMLYSSLSSMGGVELYTDLRSARTFAPLLSFNLKGADSETVAEALSKKNFAVRGGLHCSPLAHRKMGTTDRGAVRVSMGFFNTEQQIEMFCREVRGLRNL